MKIVVIGLGSMGKRRIRLLKELYPEYIIVGIDGRTDRREEAGKFFNIECFESIDAAGGGIDCAFVCTSPLSHASIISDCLKRKWNVFTEINLVDNGYDDNISLAKDMDRTLFLSSTFLYREEIKYIRSKISADKKWNYIYHIGQYLPDWHPWEDYRNFFIGDKNTNGCREIMAIELPWLAKTFGGVAGISAVSGRQTKLNIDYPDNFILTVEHENGSKGVLVVDVVCPYAVRKFEVYTEGSYYQWNGTPDSLFEYDKDSGSLQKIQLSDQAEHIEGYKEFIVENAYKNEIREFFDVINGKTPIYDFEQDRQILKLIDSVGA